MRTAVVFSVFFIFYLLTPSIYAESVLLIDERISVQVEIVRSQADMQKGLGGRSSLKDGQGMLFIYPMPGERIFWMKGMLISIDILWIKEGVIQKIHSEVPPPSPMLADRNLPTYGHHVHADMVLEVPSGYTKVKGIKTGQTVQWK